MSSPERQTPQKTQFSIGHVLLAAALFGILMMTVVLGMMAWTASSDVPMSTDGWIALGLGTLFSLVIGCGLMVLMFYSSRSGYDDVATPKLKKDASPPDRTD